MKPPLRRIQLWLVLLINSVSSQDVSVEGFVGKGVLLPCSTTTSSLVDVSWRDKDDRIVLDIRKNTPDLDSQDETYKVRVSSFPEEYQKKNFSIVFQNLMLEDSGNYECILTSESISKKTKIGLSVRESEKNSAVCGTRGTNLLQMLVLSALSLLVYV